MKAHRPLEVLRYAGLFTAITALGFLATGCSLRSSSTTPTKISQIRVWRNDQSIDTFTQLISDYQKTVANTKVTYVRKTTQNYESEAFKSMASQLGPDIWSIPDQWLGDEQSLLIPVPDAYYVNTKTKETRKPVDVVKDLYPPGIVNQITGLDGKVYGIPTGVDVLRLYYNSDLLSQSLKDWRAAQGANRDQALDTTVRQLLSKPPTTWADLINATKYITKRNGDAVSRSAIALGTADNTPNSADLLQLLMLQNGAKVVSTDHRNALFQIPETTPSGGVVNPGQNALDFLTSFANPNKDNYTWNPSMPQALDAFAQGKVAMVIGFSDFGDQLKIKYPKFRFDSTSVPQISNSPLDTPVNLIRFSVETVTKTADDPSKAFGFLRGYTATSPANAIGRAVKQSTPYLSALQQQKNEFPAAQILSGVAVYKKHHVLFDEAFQQMITDVTQNGLPSGQALDAGAETINVLLSDKQDDQ
jgi:ABC-type glycerol-3-phosphate transport system substrate-binding protein